MAEIASERGKHARAEALAEEMALLAKDLGGMSTAWDLIVLGRVARRRGDLSPATHYLVETLALAHRVGAGREMAGALFALGSVAAQQGDRPRAVRLVGADRKLAQTVGGGPRAPFGSAYERDERAVLDDHDDPALDTAWEEGQAIAVEQAIAYALMSAGPTPPALAPALPLRRRQYPYRERHRLAVETNVRMV